MISLTFTNLTGKIYYTKANSRNEALDLKEKANNLTRQGKTVVIFFDNRYLLFLAPGQDPYQVSQAIEDWQRKQSKHTSETSTKTTTETSTTSSTDSNTTKAATATKKRTKSSKSKLKT